MVSQTLHITNGGVLTEQLIKFGMVSQDDIFTWEEALCVGPTVETIMSEEFLDLRKQFFKEFYGIDLSLKDIKKDFNRLNDINGYTDVVLWFEFDLFCHINLVAVISLLEQRGIYLPKYLVCSGFVDGEPGLKGLSQLSESQLKSHYSNRISLKVDDISLAKKTWTIYCGDDHSQLFPLITRKSAFPYLSNCLKAHIERFPDTRNGISHLEYNILKLVKKYDINSERHLLGYALHYQGYYGYGDLQLERVIGLLKPLFFEEEDGLLKLNRNGYLALGYQKNFLEQMNNTIVYGGVAAREVNYNAEQNTLVKTSF